MTRRVGPEHEPHRRPTIVVTGPTAGGKTQRALRLSRHFSVPVLSLDSMKVYRGMNIGAAKPPTDLASHYRLIDIRDPGEPFSVGDYLRELGGLLPELGDPLLLSGGTAFYLNALLEGIHPGPSPDAELRARLEAEAAAEGTLALHRRLVAVDPEAAAKIHTTDLRRIVRALEVYELWGEPISEVQRRKRPFFEPSGVRLIGVARDREELYARINARVERMFAAGWVEEVRALMAANDPPWGPEASQSIGYRIIREALERGEDPAEERETIQARTRRFARSQLTWFRKMPVEWWRPDEEDALVESLERDLEAYRTNGTFPEPDADRLLRL